MRALIIYESFFGNTRKVAEAIAAGLSGPYDARVIEVGHATAGDLPSLDLLVVGGPVHGFGMARESSRKEALNRTTDPSPSNGIGLRNWLERVPAGSSLAATFDTRMKLGLLPTGSAAKGISARLSSKGYRVIGKPEGFIVTGTDGPLAPGEEERAKRWGAELARAAAGVER